MLIFQCSEENPKIVLNFAYGLRLQGRVSWKAADLCRKPQVRVRRPRSVSLTVALKKIGSRHAVSPNENFCTSFGITSLSFLSFIFFVPCEVFLPFLSFFPYFPRI